LTAACVCFRFIFKWLKSDYLAVDDTNVEQEKPLNLPMVTSGRILVISE